MRICNVKWNMRICNIKWNMRICITKWNMRICNTKWNIRICSDKWNMRICNTKWNIRICSAKWNMRICNANYYVKTFFLVEIFGCVLFLVTWYRISLCWRVVKWTKHKSTNQTLGNWWKLVLSQLLIIIIKSKSIYQEFRDKAIFYNTVVALRN